jgi:hypothetical protein
MPHIRDEESYDSPGAPPEALLHAVVAIRQSRSAGTAEAGGAWPEPKPIIAELKPVPAFDAETLLPEALRAWIMDEAERMPCPPGLHRGGGAGGAGLHRRHPAIKGKRKGGDA